MCLPAVVKVLIISIFQKETLSFQQLQEEMLTEGFKKRSEEMNEEINQLKEEIERTRNNESSIFSKILEGASCILLSVLPWVPNKLGALKTILR